MTCRKASSPHFRWPIKLEAGETVVFSWVTWPSKAVRDAGWEKLMADPRMKQMESEMPFDGKRLIYGGFPDDRPSLTRSPPENRT